MDLKATQWIRILMAQLRQPFQMLFFKFYSEKRATLN